MLFSIFPPALIVATALAYTIPPQYGDGSCCCTQAQVDLIATTYHDHLTNPDRQAAANAIAPLLADDYVQYSDSVNSLAGAPLGSIQVTKQEWINAILTSSALGPVEDILVLNDCDHITWLWRANGIGNGQYSVRGIHIFTTTNGCSQLNRTDYEFNSIAWGIDTNEVTVTPPPPPRS